MCRCSNEFNSECNANNCRYGVAYVPYQTLNQTFSPMQGLTNGTMFPELVSPYCPGQSLEEINYLRTSRRGGCR